MRVALIHMNLGLKGGLETRLYNYMRYFINRGDKVMVITSKIALGVDIPREVDIMKIDLTSTPKPIRQWVFANKVDEVMRTMKFDFSLSLARTRSQEALIAPNTHKGYLQALHKRFNSPIDWMTNKLDEKAFKTTPHIFACSEMVRQEVIDLYNIDGGKIQTLYPPINPYDFNPNAIQSKAELKRSLGLDAKKKTLLLVSTSHNRKGLPLMLEVMQQLLRQPIQLAVAGTALHNLPENVISLGFQTNMKKLYWAADLLVHPAVYEPFGQVVAEALACGCPVLVSDKTGAKEILTPELGFIVPELNPELWAKAIDKALIHPFIIPDDILLQKGLTLEQHMQRMLGEEF
ncbi:glycosyltransferase family 4 protein [soil metagenome]